MLRTFGVGAQILKDLGVRRMRVLSAPKQMHGISAFGLEIEGCIAGRGVTAGGNQRSRGDRPRPQRRNRRGALQ